MFLFVGGAFLALAIERTGLHRRLAIAIMSRASASCWQLLLAVMAATAAISTVISNTATAFIMMPMALAMLAAGGVKDGETGGMAGALPMGVAFAATIGGLGTIVGTPTNAIAAALLERTLGVEISFVEWSMFGMPMVLLERAARGVHHRQGPAAAARTRSIPSPRATRSGRTGRGPRPKSASRCCSR